MRNPSLDNYGNPRIQFTDKIAAMGDDEFIGVAKDKILLSAYANNNPRSDYHWQAHACYKEAMRREKPELYYKAFERAKA